MKSFVTEKPAPSQNPPIVKHYDVVVIGGGLSGLCAAIGSARNGAKTALIQDRSVYGGNASSEIRMHICGASCHWGKKNAAETGILMELQLENKYLNDSYNYSIWDGVLWSTVLNTKNLDSYMNTTMNRVFSDGKTIEAVECYQMSTEMRFRFTANIFIDSTGYGSLGYFAGAEYRIGTEGSEEFKETSAPPQPNGDTMGNTIQFAAYDTGSPVKFTRPDWAYIFDESDFEHRGHGNVTTYHTPDSVIVLKGDEEYDELPDVLVEKYDVDSGYWWIELGGDWDHIINQAEDIRWELYKTVYGVWDHLKNHGDHGAENYELLWIGTTPGIRESRRLVGEYTLTEHDILANRVFIDEIAYGGWPMDNHVAGGFAAKGQIPSMVRNFPGLYSIPYGCYVSKNISNLMMTGRAISASKQAMGSTRIMGTCSVGGQATGTAAALAVKHGLTPSEFGKTHIKFLQQVLLKDDCFLLGSKNEDPFDKALTATIFATSQKPGFEAIKVISGVTRNTEKENHLWISDGLDQAGERLTLSLAKVEHLNQIRLTFDPDLSEERTISIARSFKDKQPIGVSKYLIRDFSIRALNKGQEIWKKDIKDNYQRQCVISVNQHVEADSIEIIILKTNGAPDARIFEVRIY